MYLRLKYGLLSSQNGSTHVALRILIFCIIIFGRKLDPFQRFSHRNHS